MQKKRAHSVAEEQGKLKISSVIKKIKTKKGISAVLGIFVVSVILIVAGSLAFLNEYNQAGASNTTRMYIKAKCENNNQEIEGLNYKLHRLSGDRKEIKHTADNGFRTPGDNGVTLGGYIRVSVQDETGNWIDKDAEVTENAQVVVPIKNCTTSNIATPNSQSNSQNVTIKAFCLPADYLELTKNFWLYYKDENRTFYRGRTNTSSSNVSFDTNKKAYAFTIVNGKQVHIPLTPNPSNLYDNIFELYDCSNDSEWGSDDNSDPVTPQEPPEPSKTGCPNPGEETYKDNWTWPGETKCVCNQSFEVVDMSFCEGGQQQPEPEPTPEPEPSKTGCPNPGEETYKDNWTWPGETKCVCNQSFEVVDMSFCEGGQQQPEPEPENQWIYYWDEECVCTDNKNWKTLRDQSAAQDKGKCQSNSADLKQLCQNVYGDIFGGVNANQLTVYWDEECVKTDNKTIWEKVGGVNSQGECKALND
jgi:hypothetical protein